MEIVDNKCPSCGANLDYNAKTQNWTCNSCNNIYNINILKNNKHTIKNSITELICPNCNAKIFADNNIIATKCIYCDNSVIINKTNDEYQVPQKVIPFTINKEDAIKTLISTLNTKKLLPSMFNQEKNIVKITGIYIPFWLYSTKYKTVVRATNEIGFEKIMEKANITFNSIPYDANKHLDNNITKGLEPFNYNELMDFDTSYLSGFIAQKYDVSYQEGINEIDERCKTSINNIFTAKSSPNYIQKVTTISKELINSNHCYTLLPVWLLNIKYNNKIYFIAMNGQTGKISGNLPIDKRKYTIIKILAFITFFILLIIISLILEEILGWLL